jgi:hypothetical protein
MIVFQGIMIVQKRLMFFFHFSNDGFSSLNELRECLNDLSFYVMLDEMNIFE